MTTDVWTDIQSMATDMAEHARAHPECVFFCDDEVGRTFGWSAFLPGSEVASKTWRVRPGTVQTSRHLVGRLIHDSKSRREFCDVLKDQTKLKELGLVSLVRRSRYERIMQDDEF